jgi:hypothetical protein
MPPWHVAGQLYFTKLNAMCLPLATNLRLIQVQSIKLAVSPHFEINISVPGNMITPCKGNMSTV